MGIKGKQINEQRQILKVHITEICECIFTKVSHNFQIKQQCSRQHTVCRDMRYTQSVGVYLNAACFTVLFVCLIHKCIKNNKIMINTFKKTLS